MSHRRRQPLTPRVDRLESRRLLAANPLMAWEQPFALYFVGTAAGVKSAAAAPITNHHASPRAQTSSSTAHPKASGHLNLQPTHSKPAASPSKAANYVVSGHLHLPVTAPTHSKPAPKFPHAHAPKSTPMAGTVIHTASVTNPTISIATGVDPAVQGGNLGTFVITSSDTTSIAVHVVVTFTGPNKLGDGVYTSVSYNSLGSNNNGVVSGDVTLTSDGMHGATATLYVDPSTNISTSPLDDRATAVVSASSSGICCCCCGGGVTPTFYPDSASLTIQNTGSVGITVNGSSSASTTGGNPGTPATFDVHYTGNPSHAITVQLDASGSTAIPNTDYTYTVSSTPTGGGAATLTQTQTGSTVTIPAGATDVYIAVTPQAPTFTATKTLVLAVIGGSSCIGTYGTAGYFAASASSAALTMTHPDVNVRITGGSPNPLGGALISGVHPGDQGNPPSVIQGENWTGKVGLVGSDASNYVIVNYTWAFPAGAIKGYGTFYTVQPSDRNGDPDGPYLKFTGTPSNGNNHIVSYQVFSTDDLNSDLLQPTDHVCNEFYWGPLASGNQVVSVSATVKNVSSRQVISVPLTDQVTLNVIRPTGSIVYNQKGTAGLGASGGTQYLADDYRNPLATKDSRAFQQKLGIDWTATVDAPPTPFSGTYGLTQLITTVAVRSYTGYTTGTSYTEGSPLLPNLSQPGATLDGSLVYYPGALVNQGGSINSNPDGSPNFQATATAGESLRSLDSPSEGLSNNYYYDITPQFWSRRDDLSLTLMFTPSTPDSVPVPVGSVDWGWNAAANYNNSTSTYSLLNGGAGQYYNPYARALGNTDYPEWTYISSDAPLRTWRQTSP